MSYIFRMPKAGEGITEGEISKWTKAVGDKIYEDETIVEIQNDKLISDVPSPVSGTITKILVEEGVVANVGDPLAEIDAPGYSDSVEAEVEVEKAETPKAETKTTPKEEAKAEQAQSVYTFNLPKAGEGITEGEIVKWNKTVGDSISEDEVLLEVQNDKLIQDVPSPVSGVISKILVEAGSIANVGQAIAEISVAGVPAVSELSVEADTKVEATQPQVATKKSASIVGGRVLAMPSVRQLARDLDIDISKISGSGKHGHITKADVESFKSAPEVSPIEVKDAKEVTESTTPVTKQSIEPVSIAQSDRTTREKMSATRRAISSAMVTSKAHAPHVTLFEEVEVSKLLDHRKKFKEVAEVSDIKLTYLAYMTKAVVTVLRKYPILNASVDESTDEIVYKHYYNVGIAVDTDHGLYVPNVKDADSKGIFTIAKEISELAEKTHNKELTMPEMTDGSTTISNIGSAWGMWFTPIINYPEVAIFGMGRIEKKPIVLDDGSLGVGNVMYLSLSFHHRIIDGSVAQKAMNELKRLLADPELLLMEG